MERCDGHFARQILGKLRHDFFTAIGLNCCLREKDIIVICCFKRASSTTTLCLNHRKVWSRRACLLAGSSRWINTDSSKEFRILRAQAWHTRSDNASKLSTSRSILSRFLTMPFFKSFRLRDIRMVLRCVRFSYFSEFDLKLITWTKSTIISFTSSDSSHRPSPLSSKYSIG